MPPACTCLVLLALLVCTSDWAAAADIEFQASVDRKRARQTDPIRLTLTITSDEILRHAPAPELSLKAFEVDGPAVSSQTQVNMINSRVESRYVRELVYTLVPRRTGRITIGPARITLNGKVYKTAPIRVDVVKGAPGRSRPNQSSGAPPGAPGIEENLFVQAHCDRERVYVGQQLTLDYELYYRFQLYNVGFKEIPSFTGFWVKELYEAQTLQPRQQVLDGVRYNVAPLRRVALFPTSAGSHRVSPLALSCEIPTETRRRGFFDFGFGRSTKALVVHSDQVEIEVLPLPPGAPLDFTGAVGRFQVHARALPVQLPAGDPVALRVEVRGEGHMAEVQPPDLSGAQGFKVYDPKVEDQERIEGSVYGGSRIFEYILIPEQGGELEIPSLRLAYFDPVEGAYQIARSQPIGISSQARPESEPTPGYGLTRKDILEVGQDIRHIKPDLQQLADRTYLHRSGWFWAAQSLMPLAYFGLLFYQRHQRRLEGDVAYARRRRARGAAGKRLDRARQLLAAGRSPEFHAEVQHAVTAFLADQLNLAAAGLTPETCALALRERGADEGTVEAMLDLLGRCDLARFAPMAASRADMEQVQQESERIVAVLAGLS